MGNALLAEAAFVRDNVAVTPAKSRFGTCT
jgi:hypothetical protein